MLNANEYLANIYQVLVKIDDRLSRESEQQPSKQPQSTATLGIGLNLNNLIQKESIKELKDLGIALKSISSGKVAIQQLDTLSASLKTLSSGLLKFWLVPKAAKNSLINFLNELAGDKKEKIAGTSRINMAASDITGLSIALKKLSTDPKKIDETTKSLSGLFKTLSSFGKKDKEIKNITDMANSLSKAFKEVNHVARNMTILFLGIGGAILVVAAALFLSSKLLNVNPVAVLGVLALTILTITGIFWLLSKAGNQVKEGAKTGQEMGKALLYLSGGVLAFVISWQLIAKIMGAGAGIKGLAMSTAVIIGVIAAFAGVFFLLGKLGDNVHKGADTAKAMGIGLLFLSGGLLAILGITYLFSKLTHPLKDVLTIALIVGALVGVFYLMGKFWKEMLIGTAVMIAFSIGVFVLSLALKPMIDIANMIEKLKTPGKTFLTLGLVMAALIGIFALVGQPEVAAFVALGAAVITAMVVPFLLISVTLNKFAQATKTFMEIAGTFDVKKIKPTVSTMIGGILGGFIEGVGGALAGGKKGWAAVPEAIKNSAILFAGIGLLMGVSMSLSQFAKAMTAFVDLGNMKVIEGYDKNGKPIFGESVNIIGVGKTVSTTISTFLTGLLDATEDLTKKKAGAIRKMARALTGRRGMLSAVIGFSEALKVFAEFGPKGEIGSIEYIDSGKKDEDGNVIYTTQRTSTSIATVVGYMVGSFTTFIDKLAEHVDSFYKLAQDRSVKKIAKALTGKRGVLSAIIGFSDALQLYAKYGAKNEIPILDADGKQTGSLKMEQVAENIVKSLSTFSEVLAAALNKDDKKNARQAKRTLNRFDDLIEQFNKLAKAQEGLEKVSSTIGMLAQNIGLLSSNLNTFNPEKIGMLTTISKEAIIADKAVKINGIGTSNNVVNYNTTNVAAAAKAEKEQQKQQTEPLDYEKLSKMIGMQVSIAMGSKQWRFEFANDKSGVMTIS